jgi:hypothetical protein
MSTEWHYCFHNLFCVRNVPYGCPLPDSRARLLHCSTKVLAPLPHPHTVQDLGQSVQYSFLLYSIPSQVISSVCHIQWWVIPRQYFVLGSSIIPYKNYFSSSVDWGHDCLLQITSCPGEILGANWTPTGRIENVSHTLVKTLAHCQWVASIWCH